MYKDAESIINKVVLCLNNREHKKCLKLLEIFDKKFNNKPLPLKFIFKRLETEAELSLRTGDYKAAFSHIIKSLHIFNSNPELKIILLLRAGQIEKLFNNIGISPRYFSEALALAEQVGNNLLIAKVYFNISKMFSLLYPGLSLIFNRKAEWIYNSENMRKESFLCKLDRCLIYTVISHTRNLNDKKKYLILEEANRIIDGFPIDYLDNFEKDYYKYIKAFLKKDEKLLLTLIENLKGVETLPDNCRYKNLYIGICIEKGLWKEASGIFLSYKNDCLQYYDKRKNIEQHLNNIENLINNKFKTPYIPFYFNKAHGSKITMFDILDHYSLEDEIWNLDKSILRSLFPTYDQQEKFEIIKMPDGRCCLYPVSLSFNIFYRGQSEYYENSFPSLYRENVSDARRFVERIRYEELKRCINDYPVTQYFKNEFAIKTPQGEIPIELSVDSLALAQHYGIYTELMDLTTDKFVAAFFAVTENRGGEYYPILGSKEKPGVFYRYSEKLPNYLKFKAVGLQPFSRPGEQSGFVLKMEQGENFNEKVISKDFFYHDPIVSQFIFNFTNRSKNLFPISPLIKHAEEIVKSDKLSKWAYNEALKEFYPDYQEEVLKGYLEKEQIQLVENVPFSFTEEEKAICKKEWEDSGKEKIISKLIFRYNYKGPIEFKD